MEVKIVLLINFILHTDIDLSHLTVSQPVPILFSPHLTPSCEDAITTGTHNPLSASSKVNTIMFAYLALLYNKSNRKRDIGFALRHSSPRTRSRDCSPEAHGSSVIIIHRYCKLKGTHFCSWSSLMNTRCMNTHCDL